MKSVAANKVDNFFSQYPLRTYQKGQILIHAGDNPQYVFYIVKGKVRQYDISHKGDEVVVHVYDTNAFFPMMWVITGFENKYFFDVEEEVEVRVAPPESVVAFLRANPDVMYDLIGRVYTKVDRLLDKMTNLMTGSALRRVLYELTAECRRFGKKNDDGSYSIGLNENDIAARAGLSRETVNRELKKIAHENIVQVTRSGIVIKDCKKLQTKLAIIT